MKSFNTSDFKITEGLDKLTINFWIKPNLMAFEKFNLHEYLILVINFKDIKS